MQSGCLWRCRRRCRRWRSRCSLARRAAQTGRQPDTGRPVREHAARAAAALAVGSVRGAARRRAERARPRGDRARRARARVRAAAPAAVGVAQPRDRHQGRPDRRRDGGDRRHVSRSTATSSRSTRTASASTSGGCSRSLGARAARPICSRSSTGSPDASRRIVRDAPRRCRRPPLDAFENYIKGLIAESPAARRRFSKPRSSCSRVRSRRARALGRPDRAGRSRGGAGRRPRRARRLAAGAPGAFPRRRVAARAEALRRGVRRCSRRWSTTRRPRRRRSAGPGLAAAFEQPRRRPDPPRSDAADRHARRST